MDYYNDHHYTVSAWIKTSELESGGGVGRIYHKRITGGTRGFELHMSTYGNGQISAFYGDGTNYVFGDEIIDQNVADGEWHHVVAVIKENYIDGYLDGQFISEYRLLDQLSLIIEFAHLSEL